MRKIIIISFALIFALCLTGCDNNKVEHLAENIKKIELTGNLVTYTAYFHNVIEYEKNADPGITHLFEKDRKLFAEYTGTIKLGINLSEVKIEVDGNNINVFIPKAKVIGEPNVDKDDFNEDNFIESKEGINKNMITADDSSSAFDQAQQDMKKNAENDSDLLGIAQNRAKIMIEENIKQFSGISDRLYDIDWEYGV